LIDNPSLIVRLRAGIKEVRTIDENAEELLETYSRVVCESQGTTPKAIERPPLLPRGALWWGSLIKSLRLFTFGAQFGANLTLLRSEIEITGPREVSFDFEWHSPELRPEWMVFIHFLDEDGATQIQGDHRLWQYNQDPWGFVTYRLKIYVAESHLGKTYRIRLGVWNPEENIRLAVAGARHVTLEAAECAISLGDLRIA
jgi:hypothetical protein